jgi:hypothetical protein
MIESICFSFSLCAERASKGVESASPAPATGECYSVMLCVLLCVVWCDFISSILHVNYISVYG